MRDEERTAGYQEMTGSVPAAETPQALLHIRVTELEGVANRHQEAIESAHNTIAALRDQMDKVYTELGLS